MKKLIAILITLGAFLSTSCKEEIDGGYILHNIYLLQDDELVPVHNYTFDLPAGQSSAKFQLVSVGINRFEILKKSDGISATLLSEYKDDSKDLVVYDSVIYEYGTYAPLKHARYLQTIQIDADPNTSKKSRDLKFRTHSINSVPECADVRVRQSGR